jgi:hypothetical protein
MLRVALLAVLLASAAVGAAPVPKETPREEQLRKLYGTRVDETKRGTFSIERNCLTIGLRDQPPDTDREPPGAPRMMRDVAGDFVASVSIGCPLPDRVPDQKLEPYLGGGFVVMFGKGHFIHFGRYHAVYVFGPKGLAWRTEFYTQIERPADTSEVLVSSFTEVSRKPVFLRLTRKGKLFTTEHSADGETWDKLKTNEEAAPENVQIGLFALHNMKAPVDVNFWDYSVISLPKK